MNGPARSSADELTADELHSHFLSCLGSTLKYRQAPEITRHLKPRYQDNWENNMKLKSGRNRCYMGQEKISGKLSLMFSSEKKK